MMKVTLSPISAATWAVTRPSNPGRDSVTTTEHFFLRRRGSAWIREELYEWSSTVAFSGTIVSR
jgi:hypothetical protein